MKNRIRFGISNNLIEQPLVFALDRNLIKHPFQIIKDAPAENFRKLQNGQLDVALVTPYEYAGNSSGVQIIENFAIFNTVDSRYVLLFFKEKLRTIQDVAFNGRENHYFQFSKIVLQELYEISPRWHAAPVNENFDQLLQKYGCILATEEMALDRFLFWDNKIDLVEQWCNPERQFLHEILLVRDDFKNKELLRPLSLALQLGIRNLMKIARVYAENRPPEWDFYFDVLNQSFQYYPSHVTWASLEEYFKFLFYYGNIEYIPELKFISIT